MIAIFRGEAGPKYYSIVYVDRLERAKRVCPSLTKLLDENVQENEERKNVYYEVCMVCKLNIMRKLSLVSF